MKRAQKIGGENRKYENIISLRSVKKLGDVKHEWRDKFKVNSKNIEFKLDSGAEIIANNFKKNV